MQLKNLVASLQNARVSGPLDREIASIACDSRRVKKGSLFVALRGEKVDGHQFIDFALNQGATAVAGEDVAPDARATTITVPDSRAALADTAAEFFQHPSLHLKVTGITGTNGKTTVSFLLKHICERALMRSGLLGTVRYEIGDRILPATRTTPESVDVQELLFQIRSAGCKAAVMEVSSHALEQQRVRNVEFDVAIFTNLTQDHLDYHGTMENYFASKTRLFTGLASQRKKKGKAVINLDDRYGVKLMEIAGKHDVPVTTYGLGTRAEFRASNVKIDFSGTSYQLDALGKSYFVRLPLIGRFNVSNSLAAIAGAAELGIDARTAVLALANAPFVPGRLEAVPAKRQFRIFVDYAHTDDALINVMNTLHELSPNKLIVVFGCGGNRDRAKRPKMAAAVDQLADWAIITSDNPRKEDPEAIITDVKRGFTNRNFEVVVDRRDAIFKAVAMAQSRDIVLIAGKGHENYQEFADYTVPFDDVAVAQQAIASNPVETRA
ncbi:MAG: UDP-N-acetylmuramoyl-L-alanyl-D-glutamate--2,6-diaminopimelate ligase [Chthoniobacter sp.]|jgi:UDP-N-acetylmuramoyl-L-alanyl-D-glutamate--2,6-diaminopimelate ligase|nr:UDP-N-acetylmuramoyl-L-alanyl-D-glutamate--2,6-diaminopimelate ligase [Chthoniobacter sp.]